ncbi:MAG: DUF4351 domain-containing protein [Thermosynechococcaceae cyanobacterium MS004]|nr:DUF4351 domain-containing protein [Thermosynechococcaceae cyanobacterium MS004]
MWLLPLATLTAADSLVQLLQQVALQVSTMESSQQRHELSAYAQLIAGLRFDKALIRQVFQEGIMRESVIYQEILQEGETKGKLEGKSEEALSLVLRLLSRRVGSISPNAQAQIQALSLPQIEALGEALLDFSTPDDITHWLQDNQA